MLDVPPVLFQALTSVVAGVLGAPARISAVQEAAGAQGASGNLVRYFRVTSHRGDGDHRAPDVVRVISKDASRWERRVLRLLLAQGQALPVTWVDAAERDGEALVVQEYADELTLAGPFDPLTARAAAALAAIHAANLGTRPEWLPRADQAFADTLYLRASQREWERNLADPIFAHEFGAYTIPLHDALARLLGVLAELSREDQTLTLINTDLTPAHWRQVRGRPYFIDWNQAHYGSLYLDLPNLFSVDTALLYRDALARQGLDIPPADFLERYREVGRYMGLRYLDVGLRHWRDRGADWPAQRWFLYLCLTLALRGR